MKLCPDIKTPTKAFTQKPEATDTTTGGLDDHITKMVCQLNKNTRINPVKTGIL
jgi:hypothetical protein